MTPETMYAIRQSAAIGQPDPTTLHQVEIAIDAARMALREKKWRPARELLELAGDLLKTVGGPTK